MQRKMHKIGLLLLVWSTCLACDGNRVFDDYQHMENSKWNRDAPVSFQFAILDTVSKNELFIQIRNTEEYGFNNLFVITRLEYPNGFQEIDTLEYKMTDDFGNWLGNGYTNIKENKLFYKESFVFPVSGNYNITIQQAMRKRDQVEGIQFLEGISDVGFRVENN